MVWRMGVGEGGCRESRRLQRQCNLGLRLGRWPEQCRGLRNGRLRRGAGSLGRGWLMTGIGICSL